MTSQITALIETGGSRKKLGMAIDLCIPNEFALINHLVVIFQDWSCVDEWPTRWPGG